MPVELKVPSVGESVTEVVIGSWLKKEGEAIGLDETIVEIESDKATMELPSPVAGVITQIVKQTGDSAVVGEVIGYMEEKAQAAGASNGAAAGAATAAPAATTQQAPPAGQSNAAQASQSQPASSSNGGIVVPPPDGPLRVMPAAQREMAQRGIDPAQVQPSGPGGRILKEDVVRASSAPAGGSAVARPAAQYSAPQEVGELQPGEEAVAMSPIRQKIAERLVYSLQTAALLTTFNEIDMSAVIALRTAYKDKFTEKYGGKLGFMSFFIKASIEALKQFPQVNAEIRGHNIIYKNYYDIGIAVGGGKGLVVPVLRNADRMSFSEVELAISDFGERAQKNKLMPEEFSGGTFTVSNGGVYGSLMSTPIINPPQVAILGLHKIEKRPVVVDNQIVIRDMMYVALTYDHRIIDGRESVTFLHKIKDCIEDPSRILLEI